MTPTEAIVQLRQVFLDYNLAPPAEIRLVSHGEWLAFRNWVMITTNRYVSDHDVVTVDGIRVTGPRT